MSALYVRHLRGIVLINELSELLLWVARRPSESGTQRAINQLVAPAFKRRGKSSSRVLSPRHTPAAQQNAFTLATVPPAGEPLRTYANTGPNSADEDCLSATDDHGLSIRARGIYYRPGTFRSRSAEWEENVHADTDLLGFTTKHLYFSGGRKRFRVWYDRIVDWQPFSDGFGVMWDAQTAKPQSFRTGDGWFAYSLVVNLAQM